MYWFILNVLNQISLGKAYLHVLALLCKLHPVLLLLLCFQYVLTFFAIIITSASRNYLINNILKSSLRFFSSVLTFHFITFSSVTSMHSLGHTQKHCLDCKFAEAYLGLCQTSMIKHFAKIADGF